MKKRRGFVWGVLLVVGIAALGVAGYFAVTTLMDYQKSQDEYSELRDIVQVAAAPATETSIQPPETSASNAPISFEFFTNQTSDSALDFSALSAINTDTVGWIRLDGTNIDYPVVQSVDDEFYLHHTFQRQESKAGCIFLGHLYASDFSDANNVLYGHHMKDDSMFHDLILYKDTDYFNTHTSGMLYTPSGDFLLQIFSAYVTYDDANFQRSGFEGETDTNAFYDEIVRRSSVSAPFIPRWPQQIVTLVTCTYEYDQARYIVHALMTPVSAAGSILQ